MLTLEQIEEICIKHISNSYSDSKEFLLKITTDMELYLRNSIANNYYTKTKQIYSETFKKITHIRLCDGIIINVVIDDTIPLEIKFRLYHLKEVQ